MADINSIQKAIDDSVIEVAKKAAEAVHRQIKKDVYGAGTPREYPRSYEFLQSFDEVFIENIGGYIRTKIMYDPSKVQVIDNEKRYHSSYAIPQLAEIINMNTGYDYGNRGDWWWNREPFWDNALALIDRNINKWFETAMAKRGIKIRKKRNGYRDLAP